MDKDKIINKAINIFSTIDPVSDVILSGTSGIVKAIASKIISLAIFKFKDYRGKAKARKKIYELLSQYNDDSFNQALNSFLDKKQIKKWFESINSELDTSFVEYIKNLTEDFSEYAETESEYHISDIEKDSIYTIFLGIFNIIFEGKINPLNSEHGLQLSAINTYKQQIINELSELSEKLNNIDSANLRIENKIEDISVIASKTEINTEKILQILLAQNDVSTSNSSGNTVAKRNIEDSLNFYEETALFLEDETSENALTLSDIYIPPDTDSGIPAMDCVCKFLNSDDKKILVISGDPAAGKTSLIKKLVYELVLEGKEDRILTARIRDFENPESGLLASLSKYFGENLGEGFFNNKIILLDGYDEFSMLLNDDKTEDYMVSMIDELLDSESPKCKDSKIIITTRKNISATVNHRKTEYISLKLFDKDKIEKYCEIYSQKKKVEIDLSSFNNDIEELIGIPFILYMVCSLGIDISNSSRRTEIYDKIFGPDGELLKRAYGSHHKILESENNKKDFYNVILNIAFQMFKHGNLIYSLENDTKQDPIFKNILENTDDENEKKRRLEFISKTFGIISYFRQDILETRKVEFIHRTLQEYFCARYFFNVIASAFDENTRDETYLESVSATFPWQHWNEIYGSNDPVGIINYFKYIIEAENKHYSEKLDRLSNKTAYLIDKSFYNPEKLSEYLNFDSEHTLISYSENVFRNYWNLSYELYLISNPKINVKYLDPIFKNSKLQIHLKYWGADINLNEANLQWAHLEGANLEGANLMQAHLEGAHLTRANLEWAYLTEADLTRAYLEWVRLERAHLEGVHLEEARLIGADLTGAHLTKADLTRAYLVGVRLTEADLTGAHLVGVIWQRPDLSDFCLEIVDFPSILLRNTTFDKTNICYPESQLPYEKLKYCRVYIPEIDKAVPYPKYCEKYKE